MFRALFLEEGAGAPKVSVRMLENARLPDGEVTVEVSHSSINHKDALAITGRAPIVRAYPMVPGIDFAGRVLDSDHPAFAAGDWVLCNGWGLGETRWGGLAERVRVSGDWLVPLPKGKTAAWAMGLGTAGYTASLAVLALEEAGVKPGDGTILVTGTGGGLGGVALALLARRGYGVVAMTGRLEEEDYLTDLGAKQVMGRETYEGPARPLGKERWAAIVDVCGGAILANALSELRYGGVAIACGLAAGMELPTFVAPFILRGVRLIGVESVYTNLGRRIKAWKRLAHDMSDEMVSAMTTTLGLMDVPKVSEALLDGRIRGRLVVEVAPKLGRSFPAVAVAREP